LPSKRKQTTNSQLSNEDSEYAPPRCARDDDDDELPDAIFDTDGNKVVEETDVMKELVHHYLISTAGTGILSKSLEDKACKEEALHHACATPFEG
jgi:hypothetical protein